MKLIVSFTLCLFILIGCQSTNTSHPGGGTKKEENIPINRTVFTLHKIDKFSKSGSYPRLCEASRNICGSRVDYSTIAGRSGYFLEDPALQFEGGQKYGPMTLTLVMDNGERYTYKTVLGIFSENSPFASISYSNSNGYKPDDNILYTFRVKSLGSDEYGNSSENLESIKGVCFYSFQCGAIDGEVLNGLEGYFTGKQRSSPSGVQDEMKLENGLSVWVTQGPSPENFIVPVVEINAELAFKPIPLFNSDLIIINREYKESNSYDWRVGADRKAGQSIHGEGEALYTIKGFPPFTQTKLDIMKNVVEKTNVQGEALNLFLTIMLKGDVKYDDYEDFYIIHDGHYIDSVTLYFELSESLSGLKGVFRTNSLYPEYALQCGTSLEKQAFESSTKGYLQVFDVVDRNRVNVERIMAEDCGIRLKEYESSELVPNSKKEMFKLMLEFNDLFFQNSREKQRADMFASTSGRSCQRSVKNAT